MDHLDVRDLLVLMVLLVTEALPVYLALLDQLGQEEHKDLREKEEMLDHLARRGLQDLLVFKDPLGQWDREVSVARKVHQERWDLLALVADPETRDPQEMLDKWDHLEHPDFLDPQERLDLLGQLVSVENVEPLDLLVLLDPLGWLASLDHLAFKGPLVSLENQGERDPRDTED